MNYTRKLIAGRGRVPKPGPLAYFRHIFSRRHETRYRENRLAVAKHAPDFSNSFSFPCAHANPSFLSFSLLFFLLFSHSPPLSRGSSFAIFPFFPFFFFPPRLRDPFVSIHSGNLVTSFYEHALRRAFSEFSGKETKKCIVRFLMAV